MQAQFGRGTNYFKIVFKLIYLNTLFYSPSLEIFQPRLDAVLCSLLWVTLLGQGVGLGDPQRSLPTPPFCVIL